MGCRRWSPDFAFTSILGPRDIKDIELLEMKGPAEKLLNYHRNHPGFTAILHRAIDQVRDYGRYISYPANHTIMKQLGYIPTQSRLAVLIGRDYQDGERMEVLKRRRAETPDIKIITYDKILETQADQLSRNAVTLPCLGPLISRDFRVLGLKIFPGRHITQRVMWSFFVVLLEPLRGLLSNFIQALKHKHIQHRFTVAAIEPFNETILHRLAGFDELQGYAMLLGPVSQRQRDELRTIVQSQLERVAARSGYPLERAHHAFGRQVEVHLDRQRFAVEVIHHVESAKARATPQRIAHEVC
jgi:hypothetical protein